MEIDSNFRPSLLIASNRRVARRLLVLVAVSLAFVAFQPRLYKSFCEWSGINNLDRADPKIRGTGVGRVLRLELDANSFEGGLRFSAETSSMTIKTGELVHVTYWIENVRSAAVTGQAVPSYGPRIAGEYVIKVDCFCFRRQFFAPHERRELPVVFMISPKLPDDVNTVTLSYTFFEIPAGTIQADNS